jgi:hypothetical protein
VDIGPAEVEDQAAFERAVKAAVSALPAVRAAAAADTSGVLQAVVGARPVAVPA